MGFFLLVIFADRRWEILAGDECDLIMKQKSCLIALENLLDDGDGSIGNGLQA